MFAFQPGVDSDSPDKERRLPARKREAPYSQMGVGEYAAEEQGVLGVRGLVRLDDGASDTTAVTDRVAIGTRPFPDGIEVEVALCPRCACRGLTTGGTDRPGGVHERR